MFQITLTRIATVVAQEVLYGITCPLSPVRRQGSMIIQIIQGISTTITIYGVIIFERRLKDQLHHHRAMLKLASFKLIVGVEAMQDILFSALGDSGVYFPKPPYHVSWADFSVGIPQFILMIELAIVAFVFLWSFTFEPYRDMVYRGEKVNVSSWKAFLNVFDVWDIWKGFAYMFTCFTSSTFMEGPVDGRVVGEAQKEELKLEGY